MENERVRVARRASIGVVDDDRSVRRLLRVWLEAAGYSVVEHDSGQSALAETREPAAMCVDLGLSDMTGVALIEQLKARSPDLPIVVVTGEQRLEVAVDAMRRGAADYITKPIDKARLLASVASAVEQHDVLRSLGPASSGPALADALPGVVGRSVPMQRLAQQVERIFASDVTACLFGESGTGKELVAHAIHEGGRRKGGPFVALNCAAIPESLQESELFGHERGAFTGAVGTRKGRFEEAHKGTLFLDELGEMGASTQAALLRTLQDRKVRRVGGAVDIPVDVRIVCATHRNLKAQVEAGRFREDLYYRLVVYPIPIPPLRDRVEDVPALVNHFLRALAPDIGRTIHRASPEALAALARYRFPGNVRELGNIIHRSLLGCRGDVLDVGDLPPELLQISPSERPAPRPAPPLDGPARPTIPSPASPARAPTSVAPIAVISLGELEKKAIEQALRATGGNVRKAALALGMGRATLYRRIAALKQAGKLDAELDDDQES
jgi:DNA-binding NtrC family response regulator